MKKGRKNKKIRLKIVLIGLFLAILSLVYTKIFITPIMEEISQEEMRMLTMSAINEAVVEAIENTPEYTDMVSFAYDHENNIKNITLKSLTVNKLVQSTISLTQEKISQMGMRGIDIPIGSLSGMTFLSGKGPLVNLRVYPVGSVTAELKTEFTECGINQTYHKIYIRISANTSIILPRANSSVNSLTDVLIFNSIIVGKIPETYLNSTSVQDMLDLIP